MSIFNGTISSSSEEMNLTIDKLMETSRLLSPIPKYDTLVGHPEKLKDVKGIPLTVHTNEFFTDKKQIRFPRSKKKRIRKKWTKNSVNFIEVPSDTVYLIDTEYFKKTMFNFMTPSMIY